MPVSSRILSRCHERARRAGGRNGCWHRYHPVSRQFQAKRAGPYRPPFHRSPQPGAQFLGEFDPLLPEDGAEPPSLERHSQGRWQLNLVAEREANGVRSSRVAKARVEAIDHFIDMGLGDGKIEGAVGHDLRWGSVEVWVKSRRDVALRQTTRLPTRENGDRHVENGVSGGARPRSPRPTAWRR